MDKNTLIRLKFKLLGIKPRTKFLTVKEIRRIMENGKTCQLLYLVQKEFKNKKKVKRKNKILRLL